jgi:hypothetical protein
MILFLDCSSGISGDMLVASLVDLADAVSLDGEAILRGGLTALGIDTAAVQVESVRRGGFVARRVVVEDRPGFASFDLLREAVRRSSLPAGVVERVTAVAARMATAECASHGQGKPHLHELAGLDTAVDLVSAACLLEALSPARVAACPPRLGGGTVTTAHGGLVVPVPAVLALLRGLPVAGGSGPEEGELTTPTGAGLFAELVDEVGPFPTGRIAAVGVGAGQRETTARPNVLRAIWLEPWRESSSCCPRAAGLQSAEDEAVELLETTIDDASAEVLAHAAEQLRVAGALDVWLTPAVMKKGRLGHVVHVLGRASDTRRLAAILFRETTTFGLRALPVNRLLLDERREKVAVPGGTVHMRLGFLDGRLVTASPEYEDCRALAQSGQVPLPEVMAAAQAAAYAQFGSA